MPKQFNPDGTCNICGKPHPKCNAHRKRTNRTEPCMRAPNEHLGVCNTHGGASRLARRKQHEMGQRQLLEEAERRFALRKDIDPASALLDLVHYQAGVVQFWREQVELVPDDQLTWGILKKVDKTGGLWEELTETSGAAVDLTYQLLREAQKDLAEYASLALRAGIDERRVRIAEQQGEVFGEAQRAILTAMLEETMKVLRAQGVTEEAVLVALRAGWQAAQQVVVPRVLRGIAATAHAREELL